MSLHMGWFGRSRWNIERAARPWGDRPSISRFLESAGGGDAGSKWPPDLPDQELVMGGGLRWVAGAMDGVGVYHMGGRQDVEPSNVLWSAFTDVVAAAADDRVARLHDLAIKESIASLADALLERARGARKLDHRRAGRIARWLVREAADREVVKFGIVLLGVFGDADDRAALERLARHDEFTLFAVIALIGLRLIDWLDLWKIAKDVHGWGRVHVVEYLADCDDPRVRRWLVREGFRNAVMDEYLALVCAESGDLAGELSEPGVDAELFDGAAGILGALANTTWGGPAGGFESYARGVDATREFLRHASTRAASLDHLLAIDALRAFAGRVDADWTELVAHGWTEDVRAEIAEEARRLVSMPQWEKLVSESLHSDDPSSFHQGSTAAAALGMDVWETQFQRIRRADDATEESWWFVTLTKDPERMRRVVALAQERLALDRIACGPAAEHGWDSASKAHQALDLVLQALGAFPGCGIPLFRAALRSPVRRNRHLALRALAKWKREDWLDDLLDVLKQAGRDEPDATLAANIGHLLAGEPLA